MDQQKLEKLFSELDEVLTPLLENDGEFFAAVLLQTYAWWRGEQITLGLDRADFTPNIMHSDIASIVEHHAHPGNDSSDEDPTFVIIDLPSLFQREYGIRGNRTSTEETRAAVQQETKLRGIHEVDVLLERFRAERAFLTKFLRDAIREELERQQR